MRFRGLWIDISTTIRILVCRPPYQSEYVAVPDERIRHSLNISSHSTWTMNFEAALGVQDLETYNVWYCQS